MNTASTNTLASTATWQSGFSVDDNQSLDKAAPGAKVSNAASAKKAQVVDEQLAHKNDSAVSGRAPQLAVPRASTGVDATFKLLTNVIAMNSYDQIDIDAFKEKLREFFHAQLQAMDPQSLKVRMSKTLEAANTFLAFADEDKESDPVEDQFVKTFLVAPVKSFADNPSVEKFESLLTAVIVALIMMRAKALESRSKIVGEYMKLAYECTQSQAKQIIEQGRMTMIGGAVSSAMMLSMASAGYVAQKASFEPRNEAFNCETSLKNFDAKLHEWQQLNLEQKSALTDVESKISAALNERTLKQTQALDSRSQFEIEYALKHPDEPPLPESVIAEMRGSHEEFIARTKKFADIKTARENHEALELEKTTLETRLEDRRQMLERELIVPDRYRGRPDIVLNLKDNRAAERYVAQLRIDIHQASQAADRHNMLGAALIQSVGINMIGQTIMGSFAQTAQAAATIDQTNSSNYQEIVSMSHQELQAQLSSLEQSNNLVAEVLRSQNDANGAIVGNTKMQA